MKLDLSGAPDELTPRQCEEGDVYVTTKGTFVVVTDVRSSGASYLSFDQQGRLKGCGSYAHHWYEDRRRVGTVELPDLDLHVEWIPGKGCI